MVAVSILKYIKKLSLDFINKEKQYNYHKRNTGDIVLLQEFEDTKVVIRIRISKKNRQHNGQKKKYKRTNNDLQNIHIKLKIEEHESHIKPGVNMCRINLVTNPVISHEWGKDR